MTCLLRINATGFRVWYYEVIESCVENIWCEQCCENNEYHATVICCDIYLKNVKKISVILQVCLLISYQYDVGCVRACELFCMCYKL